jgi:hypothetical protein
MNVQTHSGYNPIARWGCYFVSLGKIAEDVTGKLLTDEQVMSVYAESVCSNVMGWNCFIKRPDSVLGLFLYELGERGFLVKYVGWWNADMDSVEMWGQWTEEDVTHEVIRCPTKWGHHFGLHNWNPDPRIQCGSLNGRRLFHVVLSEEAAAA